jgi:hypothetical protein
VLNAGIFIFTLFATVSMIVGFQFMGDVRVLSSMNVAAFRYFTVDSNVFAGIVSLAYIIWKLSPSGRGHEQLPKPLYVLKLAATTGVMLTMMVTVFFLAPRSKTTYFAYFMNANFFMHLITPLLCIISFVFFEPAQSGRAPFALSFTGVIPMVLYAFFYIPNILLHLEDGKTSRTYDWYGFLDGGLNTIYFVIPLLIIVTWLFALGLWALNGIFASKAGRQLIRGSGRA